MLSRRECTEKRWFQDSRTAFLRSTLLNSQILFLALRFLLFDGLIFIRGSVEQVFSSILVLVSSTRDVPLSFAHKFDVITETETSATYDPWYSTKHADTSGMAEQENNIRSSSLF